MDDEYVLSSKSEGSSTDSDEYCEDDTDYVNEKMNEFTIFGNGRLKGSKLRFTQG